MRISALKKFFNFYVMTKKIFLIIGLFIFISVSFALAQDFPVYSGYINDYAGILSREVSLKLTRLIEEVDKKTTAQVAIVTIDTTAPLDIESYAVKLFEKWGIGQKGKDNGVLLLIAVKDRAMRIEVGYGLEGAIPDALAKNIIEKDIIPFFKNGDYNGGVIRAVLNISKLIAREYNVELSKLEDLPAAEAKKESPLFNFLFLFFLIIIFVGLRGGLFWWWLFPTTISSRRKDGYWHGTGFNGSSGGFSGGFGGFGGGFSGGGGASGRW